MELIKETQREASAKEITDANALNDLLIDKRFISYANKGGSFSTEITRAKEGPTVVFRCGVNGVGKTTTLAKLAHKYKERGKKVLIVAGDTFRAGAVEQLAFWAEKVGVDLLIRILLLFAMMQGRRQGTKTMIGCSLIQLDVFRIRRD